MASHERVFGARFWSLIGATFLGFLGMGTVLPALAPHVRYDLGGSDRTVGWVIGAFSFVALASRFFSGPLADRKGRKITFLAGLFSCAVAGCAYLLPLHLAGAYTGRILQGFGEACLYTGAAAWAVEVAGVERSSQALGYLSSAIWGGISAGPAIGHLLGSFRNAALLQVVAALTSFALAILVKEDFKPALVKAKSRWFPSHLLGPGFAIGFVNVHYPVIAGFLILHLARFGNSGAAAFSTYALVILFSRFFLGSLPDRIHASITFYFGLVAMAIGLLLIAHGPTPTMAVLAAAILGFGFSFPWSSVAATVLRRTPEAQHGSTIGFLSAFYDLFVGVGSLTAGAVAERRGYSAAFLMAAGALVAAAIAGRFVFFAKAPAEQLREEPCAELVVN
ncbi:MAG TPA: MFS transporter [Bryobacteraceae bacterium]|nr:MFS transporter [Bryobacteraceae bacterium]